ncbi:hypothetical protein [uncultured Marivirga sp.]|uniref:hypothetical protein n=1 Tax=uncultured Marivirga sp. TaxID=1123707 RepID=UPI0030ED8771
MKPIHTVFLSLLSIILIASCTSNKQISVDLILMNASIVDVQNDKIIENQYVTIKGDSIFSVGSMLEKADYEFKKSIELNGQYVMPGLWDNHVHFRGGEDLIDENRELLSLFSKFGITTVRDAGGDITPSVLQ